MGVKPRFWDPEIVSLSPEKRCPFNSGNTFEVYVEVFPGPNFVSPEWRCPLNRLQMEVNQIPLHIRVQPFTIIPISF